MRLWSLLLCSACAGCQFGEGDAKVPGELLGTFDVAAELAETTCGAGALGSADFWQFELKLSRDLDHIFWLNGREVISGQIGEDGEAFAFDSGIEVEVLEPVRGAPGCTLDRRDQAEGRLSSSSDVVDTFDGTLTYTYTPTVDSDCSALVGVEGGFGRLPCSIEYAIEATRRDAK